MNAKHKLVSVIITNYNLGEYLSEALLSVINQSYKSTEIIIVDDGSTHKETEIILHRLQKDYSFIKIIRQKNAGVCVARNNGIKHATGDYIVCLDADDKLDPKYLEEALPCLDKDEGIGVVTSWLKMFDQKSDIIRYEHKKPHELLIMNGMHVSSVFRKAAWQKVGGYKPIMKEGYEDWEFWISLIEAGYDWAIVPRALFYYRVRKESRDSEAKKRHTQLVGKIYDLHKKFYSDNMLHIVSNASTNMHQMTIAVETAYQRLEKSNAQLEITEKENSRLSQELKSLRSSRLISPMIRLQDKINKIRNK